MFRKLTVLALLLVALPVRAEDNPRLKGIAPFLDERTLAVAAIDMTALKADVLVDKFALLSKLDDKAAGDLRKSAETWLAEAKKLGMHHLFVVLSMADLPDLPPLLVVPVDDKADAKGLKTHLQQLFTGLGTGYKFDTVGSAIVGAAEPTMKQLPGRKAVAHPNLQKAFAAATKAPVQLAIFPSADTRRILEEVLPMLPKEVGGGPIKPLTRGLEFLIMGIDPEKLSVYVEIGSPDGGAGKALQAAFDDIVQAVAKQPAVRNAIPEFGKLSEALVFKQEKDRLFMDVTEKPLIAGLGPVGMQLREAFVRERAKANLKELGLAMHKHHDAKGKFPAAYTADKKGKPLLSWRVQLLPYLGQEKLYKEFHLDEPWDSEHNKKLIEKMPAVFRAPGQKGERFTTTYLAPIGEDTIFPADKATRLAEISDGTSNTILLLEVPDEKAVIWTKPEDWKVDLKKPLTGLVGHDKGRFLVLMGDGSVYFVREKIDAKDLAALFTRNGGEVIGDVFDNE